MSRSKIVVLDFGSQYAHLIAKRFRMLGYYSEIALPSADLDVFENAKGVIMSGGPSSVYEENVPEFNEKILELDLPILGLCYGHQLMAKCYGGTVGKADVGEFGFAQLNLSSSVKSPLFEGIEPSQQVWMSHQDGVLQPGDGFEVVGTTNLESAWKLATGELADDTLLVAVGSLYMVGEIKKIISKTGEASRS